MPPPRRHPRRPAIAIAIARRRDDDGPERFRRMLSWRSTVLVLLVLAWLLALAVPRLRAAEPPPAAPTGDGARKTIVFLGDSLTAGYGLERDDAYASLIQRRLDAAGLPYTVVNAGVSGDTTAGGLRRLAWVLKRRADVLVICLGGNDGLRGIDPASSRANLEAMIDRARVANPQVVLLLAGMQMPPNMGAEYTDAFKSMYPAIANAKGVPLLPFILEGVGGNPELNQADGIHPTVEGQKILAETVWKYLAPLLPETAATQPRPVGDVAPATPAVSTP